MPTIDSRAIEALYATALGLALFGTPTLVRGVLATLFFVAPVTLVVFVGRSMGA